MSPNARSRGVARTWIIAFAGFIFGPCVQAADAPEAGAGPTPTAEDTTGTADESVPGTSPRRAGWSVTPSMSVIETVSDNVSLGSGGQKQGGVITSLSPSVVVNGLTSRARVNLSYRPQYLMYSNDSSLDVLRQSLNASGSLEAVKNWLFVDANAIISQQAISAFQPQPLTDNANANQVQTSTYRLSPYVKGYLGSSAAYQLRYRITTSHSQGTVAANSRIEEWLGTLKSSTQLTVIGWSIDGEHQQVRRDQNRDIDLTRFYGTVFYRALPDVRLSATAGGESSNLQTGNTEEKATYGMGFEWLPSPRTQVKGLHEKRFFGNTHAYTIRYRTPLSAWHVKDEQNLGLVPSQLAGAGLGTAFELLSDALTSRVPDPLDPTEQVSTLLQQSGIPPTLGLSSTSFLTRRMFVQRTQEVSFGLLGARNTVTFTASLRKRRALELDTVGVDDFSISPEIKTRSLSVSWAHKVSGNSNINFLGSHIQNSASGTNPFETTHWLIRLTYSHKLSPNTAVSLGARHVRFATSAAPAASENALIASVVATF